jgi:hypothetical protein
MLSITEPQQPITPFEREDQRLPPIHTEAQGYQRVPQGLEVGTQPGEPGLKGGKAKGSREIHGIGQA